MIRHHVLATSLSLLLPWSISTPALAQTAPSAHEVADYENLHTAAHNGDVAQLESLLVPGMDLEARDSRGRIRVLPIDRG